MVFQQYFRYIVAVSIIGGGNRSIQGKPSTCCKSLTNFYHIILYRVHVHLARVANSWMKSCIKIIYFSYQTTDDHKYCCILL